MAEQPQPSLPRTLGGQAVVEGVMIRGPEAMAVCVRRPNGELACHTERNQTAGGLRRVPLLRGILALGETLSQGTRAMMWSAQVASGKEPEEKKAEERGGSVATTFGFASALSLFLLGPALSTGRLERAIGQPRLAAALEGVVRIGIMTGYLVVVGFLPQARRMFGYHGAEHRAIQAYEAGEPLEVESLRRFPNAHVRCGTSFLLTTSVVSTLLYAGIGPQRLRRRLVSRLALAPVVAALSYEAMRLGSTAKRGPLRWLFRPNLALQRLTTRDPDESQMEVALAALKAALVAHETA